MKGQNPNAASAARQRSQLRIEQMDCPTEEALIRGVLGKMTAVHSVEFNLMRRMLTVEHAPGALQAVCTAIRGLGMEPVVQAEPAESTGPGDPYAVWRWAAALAAAGVAEGLGWTSLPGWLAGCCAALAIALTGLGTVRKGWIALRHGQLNIHALMCLAVAGALLLGQWPEAAMVVVLFTLAEWIEARSLDRARDAIGGLMALSPATATVLQPDGQWQVQPLTAIGVGAAVRVAPGERVGLDGIVVRGQSSVNQAPITGESLPVERGPGDAVWAGTLNQAGSLEFRVTAASGNTTLDRIVRAVEEAQGQRAPTQRFVDRFAQVYTPVVVGLAVAVALLGPLLLGGAWFDWAYRALVLLVIACPCALVIATPVTVVSGLTAAARQGILVKGGVHLENGRTLKTIALDKTGTLTEGAPRLVAVEALSGHAAEPVQALAAALAVRSDHPVSRALAGILPPLALPDVSDFESLPGRGLRGTMNGAVWHLGNAGLVADCGVGTDALSVQIGAQEAQGRTVIVLMNAQEAVGLFAVADTLRPTSRAAIAALHRLGVQTLMLTGDNERVAEAIARETGITEVRARLLPHDKLAAIATRLEQGPVGMVGDGINDAPALARATTGFAMGAMGSDTAIETADVALMDDDLRRVATFIRLSRATHTTLIQNIALALGIKAVFLVLTLAGAGSLWMAVVADVGASLLVVGNGLRMLWQR